MGDKKKHNKRGAYERSKYLTKGRLIGENKVFNRRDADGKKEKKTFKLDLSFNKIMKNIPPHKTVIPCFLK